MLLCVSQVCVSQVCPYFRASRDSLVPDRLTVVRARALLKNCLKDDGISLHFLNRCENLCFDLACVGAVCVFTDR